MLLINYALVDLHYSYRSKYPKMSSEPIKFKAGANQVYTNSEHVFHPLDFPEQDLQFDFDREMYPVVIQCVALEGDGKLFIN